jgi:hypothetical protein
LTRLYLADESAGIDQYGTAHPFISVFPLLPAGFRFGNEWKMKTQIILFLAALFLAKVAAGTNEAACGEQTCPMRAPTASNSPENPLCGATKGNGIFAKVNDRGEILSSEDGITWACRKTGRRTFVRDIAFGNGQFVAVGGSYIDVAGVIMSSNDGSTWTRWNVRNKINLHGVTYGGGQFVAVGDAGTILTSIDGFAWKSRVSGTPANLAAASFGNGVFVAGGESGVILTSSNGVNWAVRSLGPSVFVGTIIYLDGQAWNHRPLLGKR